MTTDFRALCAELATDIEEWMVGTDHRPMSSVELVDRTRTALAQPEPVAPPMPVPGDAEGLAEVFWGRYDQPEPVAPTDEEIEKTAAIIYEAMRVTNPMGKPYWEDADNSTEQNESRKCARAVLARWRNHS